MTALGSNTYNNLYDGILSGHYRIRILDIYVLIVPHLFEEKQDTVFGFPWCVVRGV